MRDTMAYLAVAESDLDTNRRINPLTPRERDGFGERLAALAYTRLLGPSSSLSTTRLSHLGERRLRRADRLARQFQSQVRLVRRDERLELSSRGASARRRRQRQHVRARSLRVSSDPISTTRCTSTPGTNRMRADSRSSRTRRARRRCSATSRRGTPSSVIRPTCTPAIAEQSIDWSFLNPKVGRHVRAEPAALALRIVRTEHARAGAQRHVRRLRQSRHVERRVRRRPRSREAGDGARSRGRRHVSTARRSTRRPTSTRWISATRSRRSAR